MSGTDGTTGLDTLVTGLFDYAGLFPPAALDLPAAMRESARAPRLRRPRMVGADLVVPLDQLGQVTRHALYFNGFGDTTCTLAVVGVERRDLAAAVRAVRDYNRRSAPWARVVSLEVHSDTFPTQARAALRAAVRDLGAVRLYLEPKWTTAQWKTGQSHLLALLAKVEGAGLKVRCAGPTAVSRATLERLLPAVVAARIPFKATQGLHHALPTDRQLGFLNLALAVRLLQAHGAAFGRTALAALLRETDPAHLAFEGGAAWRNVAVAEPELRKAQAELPFTIGSCSLAEPDDELAKLFG